MFQTGFVVFCLYVVSSSDFLFSYEHVRRIFEKGVVAACVYRTHEFRFGKRAYIKSQCESRRNVVPYKLAAYEFFIYGNEFLSEEIFSLS